MKANELRRAFTDFFASRDHTVVPSASLIPHDPTLLFTVAGMVPFKPYFLGDEPAPYRRAVTVQKCVRAGGKHNDLDEIGRTKRHLTFFEMLGNFSFGDYFKDEAIPWAWEFVTEVLGLDPDRLWVTVHLTDDEAADDLAQRCGRSPPTHPAPRRGQLLAHGRHRPLRSVLGDLPGTRVPDFGPDGGPANPEADERYVEIWNLVFMQFDQQPDGHPGSAAGKPSIDTGAGLERMLSVVQGVDSVWETDEIQRLLVGGQPIASSACQLRLATSNTDVSLAHPRRPRSFDHGLLGQRRRLSVERRARLCAPTHHPPGGSPCVPARRLTDVIGPTSP